MQNNENLAATYKLNKATCNILNYKEAVNTIYTDEGVSFSHNTDHQCDCTSSALCGPHHKDIIGREYQRHNKMNKDNSINFSDAFSELNN